MKDEHVIAWLAIGSPSDNQRPTPEHQPIYNNTIYPWYRTTYSWAALMEFPLQYLRTRLVLVKLYSKEK
jgi:hypothetical protein